MVKSRSIIILSFMLMSSCVVEKPTLTVTMKDKKSAHKSAVISSVQIINNQLVISGNGLNNVTTVKVDGHTLNENFSIESKSNNQIIANSLRAFSFDVSKVFNLILSDAFASATFPIDFSICNSTLNGKGFNCLAPAGDKDVLSYDAVSGTWKPRPATGLNYLGTFNASSNPAMGPAIGVSGAYYIINDDGTIGGVPFAVGDWLVSNGTSWQKIDNSTAVLSVFNRTGAIVAQEGDYSLDLLSDVSLPGTPATGKVLKFDGTNWVASDDLTAGGVGSVTTTSIAAGAVTDAKIDTVSASKITGTITSAQIADGTIVNADINAAAAIDYSKLNVPNGAIPYAKLNIANGDIPAAKISGLPAVTSVLATTITDNDTTHAPDGNAVFDALGLKLNLTGGSLTGGGTISNVPDPIAPGDVANRNFVDTKVAKAGGTMTGDLSIDADLRLKGTTNYVTFSADAATSAYTLTFPPTAGTNGYVLSTNGAGVLSWVSAGAASSLSTSIQAGVVINPYGVTAGDTGEVRFKELAAGGANYVALKAPDALAGDIAFVLPSVVGSSGQVLTTNGANPATLSWTTPTSVTGTTLTGDIGGTVGANTIGAAKVTLTHLSATGTKDNTTYLRGDNTWAALKADILGTQITGLSLATGTAITATDSILVAMGKLQKQITDLPGGGATLATTIVDGDTTHAPDGNAVYDGLALKLNTNGGSLTGGGTISNVPNPVAPTDVSNRQYTDTKLDKTAGGVVTGSLSLDTDVKLKGTTNYVTLKADSATAAYTLTLPPSAGTNGYVLSTNGSGVLSWVSTSVSGATLTGDIGGTIGANTIGAGKVTLTHLSATGTKDNTTYLRGDNTWATLPSVGLATTITDNDLTHAPDGNAVFDGLALKLNNTGGTLTGDLNLDTQLKLKGSSNYVTLKADSSTATFTMTLPNGPGTNGQVLTTNGANPALLTWTTPTSVTGTTLTGDIGGTVGANTIGSGKVTLTHLSATGTKDNTTYLRGDNTWAALGAGVLATPLTGLSVATGTAITAADTVLSGMGKLQRQITNLPAAPTGTADATTYYAGDTTWKNFDTGVRSAVLTGLSATGLTKANSTIADTDSTLVAFNKMLFTQGDYISKTANQTIFGSLKVNSLTGFIEVPDPIGNMEAANKQYVDSKVGIWTLGAGGYSTTANTTSTAIGIGTTTPGATVTGSTLAFGGSLDRIVAVERHPTANTAGKNLTVMAGGATASATNKDAGNLILSSGNATGSGKGKIIFRTVGNSSGGGSTTDRVPQDRVTIDDWGDMGIGTMNPYGPLNIYQTNRAATVLLETDGVSGGPYYPAFNVDNYIGTVATGTGGYPMLNLTNYRGNYTTAAAPIRGSETLGSIAFRGSYTTSGYSTYVGATIYAYTTETFSNTASGSSLKFATVQNGSTAVTDRMTINHDGNVGIGMIPASGNRLDVQGKINATYLSTSGKIESADVIKAANAIESASSFVIAGIAICTSGGCTASSDVRLKENIKPLMSSYEKIQKLNGVSYDWKDKKRFSDKKQVGLIAQDLEKVYPEVVVTDKKTGLKSVAYDHLIAPLIEAFKELVSRSDKTERKIASVMAENSELKKENAAIKAYICEKDPKAKICQSK